MGECGARHGSAQPHAKSSTLVTGARVLVKREIVRLEAPLVRLNQDLNPG